MLRALETRLQTPAAAGQRVLDLGCGDGRWRPAGATGRRVTGVDPSRVALERARAAHPELELVAAAEDGRLPFDDAPFDVVTCLHVLQHVADTQALLSECGGCWARRDAGGRGARGTAASRPR